MNTSEAIEQLQSLLEEYGESEIDYLDLRMKHQNRRNSHEIYSSTRNGNDLMGKPEMKKRFKGNDYPLTSKKSRRERGWNGFAESDTWSFDSYLAQVIPEGLKRIRAFPGHPVDMTKEEWWQVLDQIIEGMAVFDEIAFGFPKGQHAQALELKWNRAMLLFTRHFFSFWT